MCRTGLLALFLVLAACAKKSSNPSSDSSSSSDPFTISAIAKTWNSDCLTGTEPITTANHYQTKLVLGTDGSFQSSVTWYTGTCSPVNYSTIHTVYGTYALSTINGSSLKGMTVTIDFTNYNGGDLMSFNSTVRSAFNSNCGGTSPYTAGANATNGGHVTTKNMLCSSEKFPNSGAYSLFANIASYDGTTLSLGAFDQPNIPGAFYDGTIANTASMAFH